ncbi:MAG: divergent polysaccharide deacetylase family protein, partial [Candidatus Krumholzibacteria bacterium]
LLVAGGIAGVKLLQTTRGKALLMDAGVVGYYGQVQQALDDGLRGVLVEAGLIRGLEESRGVRTVGDERFIYYDWWVACEPPCNFIDINLEITRAVRRAGGTVRSGIERQPSSKREPPALVFDIGSRRYTTHKIVIEKRPARAGGAAGGASGSGSAGRAPATARSTPGRAGAPRIALVFDDFGYSKSELVESFFTFDLPITISVIPALPHSGYAIARARANGKQVILHLPMEAEEGPASDVAAVLVTMSDGDIRALVARYLAESPGVVGVNNHMGSLATQDRRVMQSVLAVVRSHRLFFLDSLTSGKSIAYNTARDMGVPAARNTSFLDADTEDVLVIEGRLLRLLETAREHGSAIAIGHPRSWTFEVLKRNLEVLKDSGIEFVFLSDLVD